MLDFITQLLDAEIDYVGLLTGVFLYIAVMWLMFCGWVFIDARKKFNSILVAILFTLFVLPLNIPGFILYLIVRPEHEDWADISMLDTEGHQHHLGGVQVPIVHFTGDEGEVHMTFGLSINPKQITTSSPDMNIDVSWDSDKSNMQISDKQTALSSQKTKQDNAMSGSSTTTSALAGIGSRMKKSLSSVGTVVNQSISSSTKQLDEAQPEEEDSSEKKEDKSDRSNDKEKSADKEKSGKTDKNDKKDADNNKKNKKSNKKKGKKK